MKVTGDAAELVLKASRVLVVTPHPDDELWLAGTLAALAAKGCELHLVCLTRGEAGTDYLAREGGPLKGEALAQWREQELNASAHALGISHTECWGLPDGGLAQVDGAEVIGRLVQAMASVDLVLSLGRAGVYGHRDHVIATQWVQAARHQLAQAPLALGLVFTPGDFTKVWRNFSKRRPELAWPEWEQWAHEPALGQEALCVDIQAFESHKRAATLAHRSQLRGPDETAFFVPGTWPKLLGFERFERL